MFDHRPPALLHRWQSKLASLKERSLSRGAEGSSLAFDVQSSQEWARRNRPPIEPEAVEIGQGRPEAARRGSLDGSVSCLSHHRSRSPSGLRGRPLVLPGRGRVAVHLQSQLVLAGQPGVPGAGHLFVAPDDMEWSGRNLVGSINQSVSPLSGDLANSRARTGLRPIRVSSRRGQATDLAVAQAVVDEDEKFARGGHPADAFAPALAHVLVVAADGRIPALAGHRLDGGPAHEP